MPWIYVWTSEIKSIYVWTTPVKEVYLWDTKIRPTTVDTPWIYWNGNLWLISFSEDWTTWHTIADKNIGATSTDITSSSSYWNYYQRWNNYWFIYWWSPTTSSSTVNASTYWPWNYYSNSTYRTVARWDSSANVNLWWQTTNTNVARRWPCPEWYHVPSTADLSPMFYSFWGLSANDFRQFFKIPQCWTREWSNATSYQYIWTRACVWTSFASVWEYWISARFLNVSGNNAPTTNAVVTSFAMPIRPFKNVAVQPDSSRTVLYQPS